MTTLSDEEIVAMICREGQVDRGFRGLVQKYQERIYYQIRRIVPDHEDANDVTQNTFMKVYRAIDRFEGKSSLYTWMYRIATNEALTFQKRRQPTVDLDTAVGVSQASSGSAYYDGDSIDQQLKAAIDTLPEKQKLVFCMRYYDELPYQEMAAALETSEGALKASYHHAVKKIESFIKQASL